MPASLAQRIVHILAGATTTDEAVDGVLGAVGERTGAPLVVLWLMDEEGALLHWAGDWFNDESVAPLRDVSRRLTFTPGNGIPGRVFASGAAARFERLESDNQFPRRPAAVAAGLAGAIAAPLPGLEGVLGVVEAFGREESLGDDQLAMLELAARQLATYLARVSIENRLRASEERNAAIVAAALDCVITMDHHGLVIDFNPAAEETFGYTREAAVGQPLGELIIPPELRERHHSSVARYLETGESTIFGRRLELSGMRADGSTFPVELTVARLGSAEPPRFAGFIRDISERRRTDAERSRLLAEAVSSRALAEAAQHRSIAAQEALERAGRRLDVLAKAGERMLAARDYEATMHELVDLAVPAVADWCAIAIADASRSIRTVAFGHAEPERDELARRLIEERPVGPNAAATEAVAATGATALVEGEDDDAAALGLRTVLSVPLRTPHRIFGVLTLALAGSERSFTADDVAMVESLGARAALAIENARLFGERSYIAETLQRSLLPARLPVVPGLEVAARYRAAGEANLVGGDFYDFFRSGDGVWTAILGDVSGKGPEAAALTALTRHTLRAGALRESSPKANLRLLNDALLANRDGSSHFATVVYARICRDDDGAVVTVSTGGHLPPLVLRAGGELEIVPIRGTLLGAVDDPELDDLDVRLHDGDLMLLYTDGVTEVHPRDTNFGDRLLHDVLIGNAAAPAEELAAAVERASVDAQDGEARDDIAIIAMRAVPAPSD